MVPTLRARVLVQTGVQVAGKAATMLSGLLLFPILTRYLGVSGFGSYTFVTGYVSFFAVLSDLGSQAIAVREMARHGRMAGRVAGQFFTAKALMGVVATVLAVLIAAVTPIRAFHTQGVPLGIILCAIALLAAPLGGTAGAVFQMALKMTVPVATDVMTRLLVLVGVAALAAGLLHSGATPAFRLDAVLLLTSGAGICGALVAFLAAQRVLRFRPVLYDPALLWPMLRDAVPLAVVLVVGIIHYRIDIFILASMRGDAPVGLYGVATKLLDVSLAISAMFMSVAFPVLSRRMSGDALLLRRAFQKSLDFMLIAGAGIAVLACLLAPSLVALVGGPRFGGAVLPLSIIAWAVPIMFVNQVVSHMIVAANRQAAGVPVVLGAASLNVVLNLVLIPRIGTVAPALITDITEGVSLMGMGVILVRHFHFGPSTRSFLRSAGAAALMAGSLLALRPFGALVAGPLAAGIYVAALFATGAVSRSDLTALLHP